MSEELAESREQRAGRRKQEEDLIYRMEINSVGYPFTIDYCLLPSLIHHSLLTITYCLPIPPFSPQCDGRNNGDDKTNYKYGGGHEEKLKKRVFK